MQGTQYRYGLAARIRQFWEDYWALIILVAVFSSAIIVSDIIGGVSNELRQAAARASQEKLNEVVSTFQSDGLLAAAEICTRDPEVHNTPHGTFRISCGVGAEFYNPQTYEAKVEGNMATLPVGMYMRVENGCDLNREDCAAKDPAVSVFASTEDLDIVKMSRML